jgi:2-haloacid dehalogenase
MRLSDYPVLTFDCYGTLIDWESGIWQALRPLLARCPNTPARDAALAAFGAAESTQERETPALVYSQLLARVHRRLAERWGVASSDAEAAAFGASVGDWPAFADSAEALAYLKRFCKLAILSNVHRAGFAASGKKLGIEFDAVYTAEDIGSYKPDPRNFRYMLDRLASLGHQPGDILHVAQSLYHDHAPANRAGLASAWIDRRHGAAGGATPPADLSVRYDFRFTSLAELAAAHRAEAGK